MARASLPLDPAAVAAANAAVHDKTDPPGRKLDPTDPKDAKLRSEWMEAYNAALAKKAPPKAASPPPKPPVQHTPTEQRCENPHFIELRYLDYQGNPVPRAGYHINSPEFSQSGTLDDDGFVRIDGLPPMGGFTYWFQDDPKVYKPRPPAVPTAGAPENEAEGYLSRIGSWAWGTVQGDFNQDQQVSQIAVNAGLGLIPIVDQALDLRDLVANIWYLIDFYCETDAQQAAHPESLGLDHETWLWIAIVLTAMGAVPTLGSAVKGVVKALLKKLRDAARVAGGLSAAQLREVWELLVRVANHFGKDAGNVSDWLRTVPGLLAAKSKDVADFIRKGFDSVETMLTRAKAGLARLPRAMAGSAMDRVERALAGLKKARGRLEAMQKKINDWIAEQIRKVLDGKHNFEKQGSIDTPSPKDGSSGNVRRQEEEPPPEPDLPKGKDPGETPTPRLESREQLLAELKMKGVKHDPDAIVDIRRGKDGRIAFLEKGNEKAGLKHIQERHGKEFAEKGIAEDELPDAVMTAVTEGKVVGSQGRPPGRPIYEYTYKGETRRMAVSVGNNGFVVGANPTSMSMP